MKKIFICTLIISIIISYGGVGYAATTEKVNVNDDELNSDQKTGKEYSYDTLEVKPAAWPVVGVVVSFIAKQGLKKAITNWSKSIVSAMVRSTPGVAKAAADDLGYSMTNYISHGQKVFKRATGKGHKYITVDKDGHNGGVWKGASTVKNLGSKKTKSGTYDAELNRIGD